MFSIEDLAHKRSDHISRREWLRVGGLGALGLSLSGLLRAGQASQPPARMGAPPINLRGSTFGKAKNVIFLWLQGGPPQHETFDPKPDAPVDIRGPFKPIATNVPGIRFCELLPRTARHADKLAVIRSLHTDDDNHDVSGYWVLTRPADVTPARFDDRLGLRDSLDRHLAAAERGGAVETWDRLSQQAFDLV